MSESTLELDRRFASAVAELDRRVDAVEVPPLPVSLQREPVASAPRGRGRGAAGWVAAAAVVLALALVAAVLVADDGGQETPVATTGGHRHLVLPPEVAETYDRVVAVDGGVEAPDQGPAPVLPSLAVRVHVPAGASAPWPDVLVEVVSDVAIPAGTDPDLPEQSDLDGGSPIDVGGPEAVLTEESAGGASVIWREGGTERQLLSWGDADDLVQLVRTAVAQEAGADDPLPGHDVLFDGGLGDVVPTLGLMADDLPSDTTTIAYLHGEGDGVASPTGDAISVTTAPGGPERWRAAHAYATDVESSAVRGVDAVIARYDGGLVEVSWMEGGDTLVRVGARVVDDAGLEAVLQRIEQLVEVGEAEWEELVATHPGGQADERAEEIGDPSGPVGDQELTDRWAEEAQLDPDLVGGTSIVLSDVAARVVVRRRGPEGLELEGEIQGAARGAASSIPLSSLGGPEWGVVTDGRYLAVYGAVPPGFNGAELVRHDGSVIPTSGTAMTGAEPNLFLLLVEGTSLDELGAVEVRFGHADGVETWHVPLD
ncbi:hypothetical protein [Actinomarinicola tropica]|uniref:Uncharacterized protein n=1 Tax=Actinomarinicola tropica TaxID=2789776 RepID=A0A5Q2REY5_9ACTN|nr:hypothetical protein [Actinomarinicola tropica]QGG95418.1 hypothetical protein GH723_10095 [Actinomarinicola tropica]